MNIRLTFIWWPETLDQIIARIVLCQLVLLVPAGRRSNNSSLIYLKTTKFSVLFFLPLSVLGDREKETKRILLA